MAALGLLLAPHALSLRDGTVTAEEIEEESPRERTSRDLLRKQRARECRNLVF